MRLGTITAANLAKRHDESAIVKLDTALEHLATQIDIDRDLAARHPGVSAMGLQRLLEMFRAYPGDVENLLPAEAASVDSYDRLVTIMGRINDHLYPAFGSEKANRLYALVVVNWLRGLSLATMIRKSIEWHERAHRAYKLSTLIRQTMDLVEQIARFKAPKYLSAYMDVLQLHLRETAREDLIDHDLDIGLQLEFGVSSKTLLSLMELGLSRMSAVALYERIAQDNLSANECRDWFAERSDRLDALDIPDIIVRELRDRLLPPHRQGNST